MLPILPNITPNFAVNDFKINLKITSAAKFFVNFFVSNIILFRFGTPPIKELINIFTLAAHLRINPQDYYNNRYVQDLFNTIGVPPYLNNFVLLLPNNIVSVIGLISIQFISNVSQSKLVSLVSTCQSDLLVIQRFIVQNGHSMTKFDLSSQPSKSSEITVWTSKYSPTSFLLTFHFPSIDGFKNSLSWLISLLFLPSPSSTSPQFTTESDYTRIVSSNFSATIGRIFLKDLRTRACYWYFDGNLVVTKPPTGNPNPPRNPQTGQSSQSNKPKPPKSPGGQQDQPPRPPSTPGGTQSGPPDLNRPPQYPPRPRDSRPRQSSDSQSNYRLNNSDFISFIYDLFLVYKDVNSGQKSRVTV